MDSKVEFTKNGVIVTIDGVAQEPKKFVENAQLFDAKKVYNKVTEREIRRAYGAQPTFFAAAAAVPGRLAASGQSLMTNTKKVAPAPTPAAAAPAAAPMATTKNPMVAATNAYDSGLSPATAKQAAANAAAKGVVTGAINAALKKGGRRTRKDKRASTRNSRSVRFRTAKK